MYIFNYIYFPFFILLQISFLNKKERYFANPLDSSTLLKLNNYESLWIIIFSTGIISLAAPVAGLNLSAIRLWIIEIFLLYGITNNNNNVKLSSGLILYVIYLLWITIDSVFSISFSYGIRVVLKYLYCFLIVLYAAKTVRDKEVVFLSLKWWSIVAIVSLVGVISDVIEFKVIPGVFWYGTARAINYMILIITFLSLSSFKINKKKNLFCACLFFIPIIVWSLRTSLMGVTLSIIVMFIFRYKVKSLPIIGTVFILFIASIFYIPSVKEKMFYDSSVSINQLANGEISKDDIDSNGRFQMWDYWLNRYYENKKLTGVGTGTLQYSFYSGDHPFGTLRVAHNDYVQILCDNGLIGLTLFGLSMLLIIIDCFIVYNRTYYNYPIRLCAIIGGSSMAGILLTMLTDNVINYSICTISYPMAFYGMMIGLKKSIK